MFDAEFLSQVDGIVATGDATEAGFEVQVSNVGPSPYFPETPNIRVIFYESDAADGYATGTVWMAPFQNLADVHMFMVDTHKLGNDTLLVLSVYRKDEPFDEPGLSIEIDRLTLNG